MKKCDGNHSKCENGKNREKKGLKQDCFRRKVCKNGRENMRKNGVGVGVSCREGGSTVGQEKFRFAPPPVVSFVRKGKVSFTVAVQ